MIINMIETLHLKENWNYSFGGMDTQVAHMAVSRDTDLQKTEYSIRNDGNRTREAAGRNPADKQTFLSSVPNDTDW